MLPRSDNATGTANGQGHKATLADTAARGWTPNELAKLLRVSPDRVRAMIVAGELEAVNTAPTRCGKPRFVILPHHLAAWEKSHRAAAPPKRTRRRRRERELVDYYPD
jgi:hypothetical protein